MNSKENLVVKNVPAAKAPALLGKKLQSLRPMRSLVAVRSFKPKTAVATVAVAKTAESITQN